jgi:ActR/RegA family two-component response regulator
MSVIFANFGDGDRFAPTSAEVLMSSGRTALLVAPTRRLSKALADSIRRAGYHLTVVETFEAAKRVLNRLPDLMITELKLAEYNGLQLALRGQTLGIRSIVVADKSFEQEVERLGAAWMSPESSVAEEFEATLSRVGQDSPSDSLEADSARRITRNVSESVSFPTLLH